MSDGAPELRAEDIPWSGGGDEPARRVEATTEDLLVEALRDSESYRLVAQQAIHALHELTIEHDRLRETHHRLIAEYRRLRESILREGAA